MYIIQYAITLPMTASEADRGHHYMVARASVEDSTHSEGVEPIVNCPATREGKEGRLTYKRIHMSKSLPGWLVTVLPKTLSYIHETCVNTYPTAQTFYESPFFKDNLTFELDTVIIDNDRGDTENPFYLTPAQLKGMKRMTVDIASNDEPNFSPSTHAFSHPMLEERGMLTEGWQERADPVCTVYKLVRFELSGYLGLGSLCKGYVGKALKGNFCKYHSKLHCWMDDWYPQSREDVITREVEQLDELAAWWVHYHKEKGKPLPSVPEAVLAQMPQVEREALLKARADHARSIGQPEEAAEAEGEAEGEGEGEEEAEEERETEPEEALSAEAEPTPKGEMESEVLGTPAGIGGAM
ncbi:phosphatidylinositol transfer protein [Kipferlia bialata]|uniref:Phosphatidylinositol transfer protein n=1 Tax=Kipferlia bialata TaxID=797122 RepID=A0A9K3GKR2_9EUKA|nr:phosphatidylinositol transfer protein [Kipferlia bialata]|eukprot:g8371.t1